MRWRWQFTPCPSAHTPASQPAPYRAPPAGAQAWPDLGDLGLAGIEQARRFRQLLAKFNKARDLIQLGAYVPGHDAELDQAVRLHPKLNTLLQQDMHEPATLDDSFARLGEVIDS